MEPMANGLVGWPRTPYNWLVGYDLAGRGLPIVWLTKPGVLQPRPRGRRQHYSSFLKKLSEHSNCTIKEGSKQPTAKDELK